MACLPKFDAIMQRQGKKPGQARVSMTDAEVTVLNIGDGGFRSPYNPQPASDAASLVIVGVDVVTVGSDQAQRMPMIDPIAERFWPGA